MSWKKHQKAILTFAAIVLGLWLVVLVLTIGVIVCGSATTVAKWGQFGDAFGVVNALFSGLALLGVIAAVLLQREDIELQVKEMRASIAAQEAAAEMQEKQARIAALAEMLHASNEMVEYLKHNERQPTTHLINGENR